MQVKEVNTLKELATIVKKQNQQMDDVTFVFYAEQDPHPLSIALIQNETKSNLIRVRDRLLAEKLNLKLGKFYCYYRPSFANYDASFALRPNYLDSTDDDMILLKHRYPTVVDQLLNQKYRDELEIDEEIVNSEEFQEKFRENQNLLTKPFMDAVFDQCFENRTFNVQFLFNPDFRRFKQLYQNNEVTDKPILFVYAEMPELMESFGHQLRDLLTSQYEDVFECFYSSPKDSTNCKK